MGRIEIEQVVTVKIKMGRVGLERIGMGII